MKSETVKIAWYGKHFGEEPPLIGTDNQGAGTIFFSGCNLRCLFCQNYQISHQAVGEMRTVEELSAMMLDLQTQGAVNIDLVTPTLWWRVIKEAIILAKQQGLILPIVWNSNAYETIEILKEMDGLVDIYLPDIKYGLAAVGEKYSGVKDYPEVALAAIKEMYRQVGLLQVNDKEIATRGLIVRHLVLPNNLENSFQALKMVMAINPDIHIGLMNQYSPLYRAFECDEINRVVSKVEFQKVYDYLLDLGWNHGWAQTEESQTVLIPDFMKNKPFENNKI